MSVYTGIVTMIYTTYNEIWAAFDVAIKSQFDTVRWCARTSINRKPWFLANEDSMNGVGRCDGSAESRPRAVGSYDQ